MKFQMRCAYVIAAFVFLIPAVLPAQEDKAGSQDYPLFSRWPGYHIDDYEYKKFNSYSFQLKDNTETVEGEFYRVSYYRNKGVTPASELEIIRNYENAIRKAGGTVLHTKEKAFTVGKVAKDGKEIWVHVRPWNHGYGIELNIVERQAMDQTIQANAAEWFKDISATGRVAVYGIYFDVDKADIKPESEPTLAEMAKLLKDNAGLKVFISGHTDNTGAFEHNMKLSQDRANAVVGALVSKHGIAAARLKGVGVGPISPVASNKTEEGRAKNRRVELVEQ